MDQAQARALLAGEPARLVRMLAARSGERDPADLGDEVDDVDRRDAEQTGTDVDQLLRARWAALQRAEARLAAGSYGRSPPARPAGAGLGVRVDQAMLQR
jgi:hypothetical protein